MYTFLKSFALACIVCLFTSCNDTTPTKTSVSLLVDLTGSYHDNVPDISSESILQLFALENTYNYGSFRTDFVSDVNYSKVQQITLPSVASMLEYNEFEREGQITDFKKKIDELINKVNSTQRGRPNSAVYIPIAREINRLANMQADRKVIIIYSDLLENSNHFRFYEQKSMKLLAEKPEEIQTLFEKQLPLADDLAGIHVYIIYQAPNETASTAFQLFSNSVYLPMLEAKGATVTIGANLVL